MNTLIILIKNPIKGKAKTRLAKTVGEDEALRIYKKLLGRTRDITSVVPVNRQLYYSHFIDSTDEWNPALFEKYLQEGNNLGNRMTNAFQNAFQKGFSKVIIMGSDCANLTSAIIQDAFDILDTKDFVIGPALDGGYYLLGMNAFYPEVFENITWSTESVLKETLEKITILKKSYDLLPELSDIDFEEDWEKYGF